MITIRSGVSADQHQLLRLVGTIDAFHAEDKELAREIIHDGLPSGNNGYEILVAVDRKQELCGFICYGAIPLAAGRWDVYLIAVSPASSRRGVGRLLMGGMAERLDEGMHVYIDTSGLNSGACAFYERLGYEPVCRLPDFYADGDDKIVYAKVV